MLSEAEGCAVLKAVFERRGFVIAEDVPFDEAGVSFRIDGWDAGARVGYEYLTNEAGDRAVLDAAAIEALALRMEDGDLYLLLVDETEGLSREALTFAAESFLDEVARRRAGGSAP